MPNQACFRHIEAIIPTLIATALPVFVSCIEIGPQLPAPSWEKDSKVQERPVITYQYFASDQDPSQSTT